MSRQLACHREPGAALPLPPRRAGARAAADPALDQLADRIQRASAARFAIVTKCGHVRGEIIGTGEVQMITGREQGETIYLAVRTTAPAGSGRQGPTTSPPAGTPEPGTGSGALRAS